MGCLQENIEIIESNRPELKQVISNISGLENWIVDPSEGVRLNVSFLRGAERIWLHDRENPKAEAQQTLDACHISDNDLVVVLGVGIGHLLKELENRFDCSKLRILVIEQNPALFIRMLESNDLRLMLGSKSVRFWLGCSVADIEQRAEVFFKSEEIDESRMKMAILRGTADLFNDYYAAAMTVIRRLSLIKAASKRSAALSTDLLVFEHVIRNVPNVIRSNQSSCLKSLLRGEPAIVIGSGPSLDKQLSALKEAQFQYWIVATNSALEPLLLNGVRPTVLATNDHANLLLTSDDRYGDYVLFAPPVVPPERVINVKGRMEFVTAGYTLYDQLGLPTQQISMGSASGNAAFAVADYLGCDPIIFIGLDYAGGPDRFHASGTLHSMMPDYDRTSLRGIPVVSVKGYYGSPITTLSCFDNDRKYLELQIGKSVSRVINSTEGGSRIHGAVALPFAEALAEINVVRDSSKMKELMTRPNQDDERARKKTAERQLEVFLRGCEEIVLFLKRERVGADHMRLEKYFESAQPARLLLRKHIGKLMEAASKAASIELVGGMLNSVEAIQEYLRSALSECKS